MWVTGRNRWLLGSARRAGDPECDLSDGPIGRAGYWEVGRPARSHGRCRTTARIVWEGVVGIVVVSLAQILRQVVDVVARVVVSVVVDSRAMLLKNMPKHACRHMYRVQRKA